jgi:hypothetical protein
MADGLSRPSAIFRLIAPALGLLGYLKPDFRGHLRHGGDVCRSYRYTGGCPESLPVVAIPPSQDWLGRDDQIQIVHEEPLLAGVDFEQKVVQISRGDREVSHRVLLRG